MLHELLLGLIGITGDFVIDERDEKRRENGAGFHVDKQENEALSDECTFKLAPDISFLQCSERELIEQLLRLGFYYRELDRFSAQSRNLSWITSAYHGLHIQEPQKPQSIYRRAIANGISEVLSAYRSAVLEVEQNILGDPVPVLTGITQVLNKFEVLLPPLHALVLEIEREDYHGGRLLNLIHKRCHCGVPELQAWMRRLLWHGHQVMYHQLAAWMVHGILQDAHGEFFIARQHGEDMTNVQAQSQFSQEKSAQISLEDSQLDDWHAGFHLFLEMLPEYIPLRVAESILFVGKAVRLLCNPSSSFLTQKVGLYKLPKPNNVRQGLSGSPTSQKEPVMKERTFDKAKLLPPSEADKITEMLQTLKDMPEFHKRSFESAVDSIRAIAATHLWQLVVVHADLTGHLKALKDYFLLAKGDFFQCFLEESHSLMRLPPRPSTAEADLKVPFQQAAIKTNSYDDKYFSRVSLRMPSLGSTSTHGDLSKLKSTGDLNAGMITNSHETSTGSLLDGWDGIALEYCVEWPLQLLFTREVLARYCKIFQYLLRLKRIQLELEKSWALAMQRDHAYSAHEREDKTSKLSSQKRQKPSMPMWRLRHHMAYLITNLQFYIQVDVIESQWNLLQEHVKASEDFGDLVRFHNEYLSALISQSFLDIGSVSRILDNIIKLCLQLCRLIEQHDGAPNAADLEQITEEFNKKSNSLYTILRSSKLAGSHRAPFLRQFLLRLNYNSVFETAARGALNVVRPRRSLSSSHASLH